MVFTTPEHNKKVFSILEDEKLKGKKKTGRTGMDLWMLFVLAQTRLCLNISYDELHRMANVDKILREIMGIEFDPYLGLKPVGVGYQNIIEDFINKNSEIAGWRKLSFWYKSLKNAMRVLGQVGKSGGKDKDARQQKAA